MGGVSYAKPVADAGVVYGGYGGYAVGYGHGVAGYGLASPYVGGLVHPFTHGHYVASSAGMVHLAKREAEEGSEPEPEPESEPEAED